MKNETGNLGGFAATAGWGAWGHQKWGDIPPAEKLRRAQAAYIAHCEKNHVTPAPWKSLPEMTRDAQMRLVYNSHAKARHRILNPNA